MKRKILLSLLLITCFITNLTACDLDELLGTGSELKTDVKPNITEILSNKADSVSYDIEIQSSSTEITLDASVWMTDDNIRIDTTLLNTAVTIFKDNVNNTQYTYSKYLNVAYKTTDDLSDYTYSKWLNSIDSNNCEIIGEQRIDGKLCAVITYTYDNTPWTIWLYEKYAFPIKIKNDEITIKFTNIAFNKTINAAIFELPENAKIIDEPIDSNELINILNIAKDFISKLSGDESIEDIFNQVTGNSNSASITELIDKLTNAGTA